MPRWRSREERRREIHQELFFAAAGIGDLVPDGDEEDEEAPRCPECYWIWPDDAPRCAGCGYPDPIDVDGA